MRRRLKRAKRLWSRQIIANSRAIPSARRLPSSGMTQTRKIALTIQMRRRGRNPSMILRRAPNRHAIRPLKKMSNNHPGEAANCNRHPYGSRKPKQGDNEISNSIAGACVYSRNQYRRSLLFLSTYTFSSYVHANFSQRGPCLVPRRVVSKAAKGSPRNLFVMHFDGFVRSFYEGYSSPFYMEMRFECDRKLRWRPWLRHAAMNYMVRMPWKQWIQPPWAFCLSNRGLAMPRRSRFLIVSRMGTWCREYNTGRTWDSPPSAFFDLCL